MMVGLIRLLCDFARFLRGAQPQVVYGPYLPVIYFESYEGERWGRIYFLHQGKLTISGKFYSKELGGIFVDSLLQYGNITQADHARLSRCVAKSGFPTEHTFNDRCVMTLASLNAAAKDSFAI